MYLLYYQYLFVFCTWNWNYHRTGSFEFSSIQNINLKDYNLYYFNTNKYGEDYANMIDSKITKLADAKSTYADKQREIKTQSLSYIKKDWLAYSFLHLKGSVIMFLDPSRFDLYNFFEFNTASGVGFLKHLNANGIAGALTYLKNQPFLIILLVSILLLFNIFKIIGFLLYWVKYYKTTPKLYWFMLFIIVYIVGLTGLIGAARFLVPILPIYILFATIGITKTRPVKTEIHL